ncbi:putative phage tail assembly chaperone [Pasteurellaceae bacterium TAE3-ERU1]|nr:putative phage tail assembly chaperone [Pasteurellaceae bacterium TAE3-ERU1]
MNKATELLDQLQAKYKSNVTISINGYDFVFHRDDAAYDAFLNEVTESNKLTPMKDYLLQIVERNQKDDLLKIIHLPGIAAGITAKVNGEFIPKLEITVKN